MKKARKEKKTLRQLRKENRYTINEVSEGSGVPFSSYTAYELGYRKTSLEAATKLADFYKCSIEDIDFDVKKED